MREARTYVAGAALVMVMAAQVMAFDAKAWMARRNDDRALKTLSEQYAAYREKMTSPVENLMIPIEYFPDGRVKTRLTAKHSQIFLDGMIFADGVCVMMQDEDGSTNGFLTAESCLVDRNAKIGYSDGAVFLDKEGTQIRGVGIFFSFEEEFVKILSKSEIRTSRMKGNFGRIK